MIGVFVHRDENGAVTIIVALFITVLFAFAALSVDVARLYEERRALVAASDLSALSGAQVLWKSKADAESLAETYVTFNPTINHPGAYNETTGDLVDADRVSDGDTGCPVTVDGVTNNFDCVRSTVTAGAFHFLFGSVIGFQDRKVTARSTAVLGNGALSGEMVAPWMVMDCPNSTLYPDESGNTDNPNCPYSFNDVYSGQKLTLQNPQASGTNFKGVQMVRTSSGCPIPDGYHSGETGSDAYKDHLSGEFTASIVPCGLAPGARISPQTGNIVGPTEEGLNNRRYNYATNALTGTTGCAQETAFNAAFDREGDGDGFVSLRSPNPCVLVINFVAHDNPGAAGLTTASTKGDIRTMQFQNSGGGSTSTGRFAAFSGGSGQIYVVRRQAFFYLTSRPADGSYVGLLLRSIDGKNATLIGPMDPSNGIFVTKLTG